MVKPRRTKKVNKVFDKLNAQDVVVITEYITKMLLHQMVEKYITEQKNKLNPLSI